MCAFKLRDPALKTIEEVVVAKTGMSRALMQQDTTHYEIVNLQKAADIIIEDINRPTPKRPIVIRGDYDVDGQTSTAILYLALRRNLWLPTSYIVPKRSDGYGVTMDEIESIKDGSILILVDNGIVAFDQVKRAKEKGLTVIILDHHLPLYEDGKLVLPEADVIVDPHAFQGTFNDYCGAGLAYKLVELLVPQGDMHSDWPSFQALAAIGTICDVMPLVWENRRIVKEGLEVMNTSFTSLTVGLQCFIDVLDLYGHVDAKSVGFKIGPSLNAVDRLNDGGCGYSMDLLTYKGRKYIAKRNAEYIAQMNQERKTLTEQWMDVAREMIENCHMADDYPIVCSIPGIHEGIIGIIAGRVSELYQTPTIILSGNEGEKTVKGSGRSYGDVHLKDLLDRHSGLLEKYGGHSGAAGLTVKTENVDALRKALNEDLGEKPEIEIGDTYYDLEISGNDIPKVMEELKEYAPFGEGNPSPVFLIRNLTALPNAGEYYRLLSSNGLRIYTSCVSAVTFDATEKYLSLGAPKRINLIGSLSENFFKGNTTNQLEFVDVESAEVKAVKSALQHALERKALERYA